MATNSPLETALSAHDLRAVSPALDLAFYSGLPNAMAAAARRLMFLRGAASTPINFLRHHLTCCRSTKPRKLTARRASNNRWAPSCLDWSGPQLTCCSAISGFVQISHRAIAVW